MLATNHRNPRRLTYSARLPWRRRRRTAPWWSDGIAIFRGATSACAHSFIPVDVFVTGDPDCPEIHVDARYVSHAADRFPDCSFWRLHDTGIAVRDRYGFQIVGLIRRRPPPPDGVHRSGGAL